MPPGCLASNLLEICRPFTQDGGPPLLRASHANCPGNFPEARFGTEERNGIADIKWLVRETFLDPHHCEDVPVLGIEGGKHFITGDGNVSRII
jgi:hypothetical protein